MREKQAKSDAKADRESPPATSSSPMNIVHLSPEKPPPEAVWQDVPNCYVPESCSTLPRQKSSRGSSPLYGHDKTSKRAGVKPGNTPDATNHSEATDIDSVFCAITPIQTSSTCGDSGNVSQAGTPVTGGHQLTLSSRGSGGKRSSVSTGQVSLDGPEYGLRGSPALAADRRRSNSCGNRPINRVPLTSEPMSAHHLQNGRPAHEHGGIGHNNVSVYPGSVSPQSKSLPRETAPPSSERQLPSTSLQFREVESELTRLSNTDSYAVNMVKASPSPVQLSMHAQGPLAKNGVLNSPAHPNAQGSMTADILYSYDSLKAEVDALRQKVQLGAANSGTRLTVPQKPYRVHTADV